MNILAPLRGAISVLVIFRWYALKTRVPPANVPTRLRRAEISKLHVLAHSTQIPGTAIFLKR